MPAGANGFGDIFGGRLMSQSDITGATMAIRVAGGRVATLAVNEFRFMRPIAVGELVDPYARVNRVGNTSVSVEVRAFARREADPQLRREAASELIAYVAIGENGRSRPVTLSGGE